MKVKASQRLKNAKDPWYGIRLMNADEATRAKNAIIGILKRHTDGLHYGNLSPEDAILEKLQGRGRYGDRNRQRLVFRSIMRELRRLQAISYDPARQRIGLNPNSLMK